MMEPLQLPPINRHGQCPNCEYGWDGGDVLEQVSKLSVFAGTSDQQMKQIVAANYGYTENNKIRFTQLIGIEISEEQAFWQCPKCKHVWDRQTNYHYANLNQALNKEDNKVQ